MAAVKKKALAEEIKYVYLPKYTCGIYVAPNMAYTSDSG